MATHSRRIMVINFSHPLTPNQIATIKLLARADEVSIVGEMAVFDLDSTKKPLQDQVRDLLNRYVDFIAGNFDDVIFNLPGLSAAAALMMKLLIRRFDADPHILLISPIARSVPPRYEVKAIL